MRRIPFLLFLLLLFPAPATSQDVRERLGLLALDNARLYVEPVVVGLGSALNAGVEDRASVHGRLGFDIGVRVMAALPPSEAERFRPVLPGTVEFDDRTFQDPYGTTGSGFSPTVAGAGPGAVLEPQGEFRQAIVDAGEDPDDFRITFPEGLDLTGVPLAFLEGGVGIGFGTEVSGRLLPSIEVDDEIGSVSAWGVGVKHSLTRYFPTPTPLFDVAVYAGYHSLEVGDYLDATGTSVGAVGHVGLGLFRLYAAGAWNDATVDVAYTVENPDDNPALPPDGTTISFSEGLDWNTRFALGAGVRLLLLDFAAEYAFADYDTLSARVSFSFR